MLFSKHSLWSWKQLRVHSDTLSFPFLICLWLPCLNVAGAILCALCKTGRFIHKCSQSLWWYGAENVIAIGYIKTELVSSGCVLCTQALRSWSKGSKEHGLLPQACSVSQPWGGGERGGEIVPWYLSAASRGSTPISFSFYFKLWLHLGWLFTYILQTLYFLNTL